MIPEIRDQLEPACGRFRRRFGQPPRWAAAAPGRVNLIGEHTDYNGGFVLPIAIDRRALVLAARTDGPTSTLWAADLGDDGACVETDLATFQADGHGGFEAHLAGVARLFHDRVHPVGRLKIMLTSTVPIGAGLSSSAAVEVAMATLLEQVAGETMDSQEMAHLCQDAEHRFAGSPCGIMDMLVAVEGRSDQALLIDCRAEEWVPIALPATDAATFLVAESGVRHRIGDGTYAERRDTCAEVAAALGLESLRDATLSMLARTELSKTQIRRAAHVISENTRTLLAAKSLEVGDLDTFGELLLSGHDSLRDMFQVSCPELDCLVDSAASMIDRGVFGARMTGGGFGGCVVIVAEPKAVATVIAHLCGQFLAAFGRTPTIYAVRAVDGATALEV